MLGNVARFCYRLLVFQLFLFFLQHLLFAKTFQECHQFRTIWTRIRPDEKVGPDLGPNCFQRLSADDIVGKELTLCALGSVECILFTLACFSFISFFQNTFFFIKHFRNNISFKRVG